MRLLDALAMDWMEALFEWSQEYRRQGGEG